MAMGVDFIESIGLILLPCPAYRSRRRAGKDGRGGQASMGSSVVNLLNTSSQPSSYDMHMHEY